MDTPDHCRDCAARDAADAAGAVLPNERLRLERSAFAWRLRAEMLERRRAGRAA